MSLLPSSAKLPEAEPPSEIDAFDREAMGEALRLAAFAATRGEVPVGAVLYDAAGELVGSSGNLREGAADPTAHAELEALRQAAQARGEWRLVGTTLYVTLEPCPMCAGALVNARVRRVVYGCADPKAGAMGSLYHIGQDGVLNHRVEVRAGVLASESASLLRSFFAARRGAPSGRR